MIDIGITKLMIVAGIALVVIGPERLPRVARTVGTLLGRAQRYVSDVKAEVSRSIELEELQRARREFESATRDVHSSVASINDEVQHAIGGGAHETNAPTSSPYDGSQIWGDPHDSPPRYERPRKNWRIKRGALPHWYKKRQGVRMHVQSAAARVARHRPARSF